MNGQAGTPEIFIPFLDCNSNIPFGRRVIFTPISPPTISGSYLAMGDPISRSIDANGYVSASLIPSHYLVNVNTNPQTTFFALVTGSTFSVISASNHTGSTANVFFNLIDHVADWFFVKKLSLTPTTNYPWTFNGSIIIGMGTTSSLTDASGSVTFDALIPGVYDCLAKGKVETIWNISVPAIGSTWNGKDLIVVKPAKGVKVKVSDSDNSFVLTVSSSDARYASGISSSYANSASNAISSSYAYASTLAFRSQNADNAGHADIADDALTSISASYALSASYVIGSSNSSSWASSSLSSSYALNSDNAISSSISFNSTFAGFATEAGHSQTADDAINAVWATNAAIASNAWSASVATSSSYAVSASNADTASYVLSIPEDFTASNVLITNTLNNGVGTIASGQGSHAEGLTNESSGSYSHAEGSNTIATGFAAHSEGSFTHALEASAHAEGLATYALQPASHAEGSNTSTKGFAAHSEGDATIAAGDFSHAEGRKTTASGSGQTVMGYSNIPNDTSLVIIGNGDDYTTSDLALFNRESIIFNQPLTASLNGTASFAISASHGTTAKQVLDGDRIFLQDDIPTPYLTLIGNGNKQMTLNDSQLLLFDNALGQRVNISNIEDSFINTPFNFGVGTDTPTEKVDVVGNIKADNFLGTASIAISASWAPGGVSGTSIDNRSIVLCSAFTPTSTGEDDGEMVMPYSSDGVTSVSWSLNRVSLRVKTPGILSSSITIQKSIGSTTVFSSNDLATLNLISGAYYAFTGSTSTINSGDLLRFNVVTLGDATKWNIICEISKL